MRAQACISPRGSDGESAPSGEMMYSFKCASGFLMMESSSHRCKQIKKIKNQKQGLTTRKSLLRLLYDTRDSADCYGSGVCKISLGPQQLNVSVENTDAIISKANSSLRAARLASLPLCDDLFMNGRFSEGRVSQSSGSSACRCLIIGCFS